MYLTENYGSCVSFFFNCLSHARPSDVKVCFLCSAALDRKLCLCCVAETVFDDQSLLKSAA